VQLAERSEDLNKYRRIEVKAFRHRVNIVSGEWPRDIIDSALVQTDGGVLVNESDLCEPVEPDSPEGQQILVDAVRSLERRLTPEARAAICADRNALTSDAPNRDDFYLKVRSIYGFIPKFCALLARRKGRMRRSSRSETDSA